MFNIFLAGQWPAFDVRFTPASEAHLLKHSVESPEIQPHFIERVLHEAEPRFMYLDHTAGRYIFEGYICSNPYRVVVEMAEENGRIQFFPVSAHRINHRTFMRRMKQQQELE